MTRKLWVSATVVLFSATAVLAGLSHTRDAAACDEAAKSAAAGTSSCCAKDGTKTASTDAKKVQNSMIKSAVVAPGAAPILNVAAFAGSVQSGQGDCDWCPGAMSASACASNMSAAECAAMAKAAGCPAMQNTATTASYEGCSHASAATVASTEQARDAGNIATATVAGGQCAGQTTAAAAASDNCCKSGAAAKTASADGEACEKSAAARTAGASCCKGDAADTAAKSEKCADAKTASLKGVVDVMPYHENKRVVLAGSYACGHCTLSKTEACAPMIKTADGKVYPLLGNDQAKDLRSLEGKNVELSGTVKKIDGVKYLDVKSYKVI